MNIKGIFVNLFSEKPMYTTTITNSTQTPTQFNSQQLANHFQSISGNNYIIKNTYYHQTIDNFEKQKVKNEKIISSYSNETQNLLKELEPHIQQNMFYHLDKSNIITVGEIIEKHLKNIKFSDKLDKILED